MYLKRVEAKGFKSFADKVELELDIGITGIVGPNGSGKSNISDAVRWVLGEQSAKTLRGMRMEDVIFAGTSTRKPLGFAEVSITIDNSDNMLPVDYTEITVTRRMYRSGESEYFINKTPCRLKDITEFFMDTGVGRDGYSIIGQGRIDEILNAKAEDRREIFEEAAGIVKYKSRKQEAEKRLDTTEQNIIRINDIINELETQLEPLYEQSVRAKKYLDLREQLKNLEINIFVKNMDKLREKVSKLTEDSIILENDLLENNRKSARLEEEYNKAKMSMEDMDHEIERAQNELFRANNDIERLQGEANVLNEKKTGIERDIHRLEEEIGKESSEIKMFEAGLCETKSTIDGLNNMINENQSILELKEKALQDINNSISDKEKMIEDMKAEVIELLNKIADKKSAINSYNTFNTSIEKRKIQINSEKISKNNRISELQIKISELNKDMETLKQKLDDLEKDISQLEIDRIEIVNRKRNFEKAIFEINEKLQSRQARLKVLNEMENEFEGYSKSVKEIMKLKGSGSSLSHRICGVVADLMHVHKQYETAIESSLGSALQNIVTEEEFAAKECIEYLKINKFGRATFLPLTTVYTKSSAHIDDFIKKAKGFIGIASELVSCDKKYDGIISSLLGRVIVVENLDDGIDIAKKIKYSMKIVTLDGDIISSGGAFTGGSINQKAGRILSRKREIDELDNEIAVLKEQLNKYSNNNHLLENRLQEIDSVLKGLIQLKTEIQISLSSCNGNFDMANSELLRLVSDLESLDSELYQLELEDKEAREKIEEESKHLYEFERISDRLSNEVHNEQSGIKDILKLKEQLVSEITAIRVKMAELKQNMMSLKCKVDEISASIKKCNDSINEKRLEIHKDRQNIDMLKQSMAEIELLSRKASDDKNKISIKLNQLNDNKKECSLLISDIEKRTRENSQLASGFQNELHRVEMQKARLDIEMETLQNRIWEDYEISYASAQKYRIEIDNDALVSKNISLLKDEIKELGAVNVGAIDEYKRVKERYEFMKSQKLDLEEAKNSLEKVISEMTEKMLSQFEKNFAVINENFNSTFQRLFGGGKAELILCNKEDILSSGIEIVAEPPGKKLQSLTLLSGGEKALTAIALLFGILKMKPSPFCILDEIEAALDDVNVARYARFLKELSRETQFIIVTHRKGTMEIADVLYGVTMEEKGVSRLISVKLSEKAS